MLLNEDPNQETCEEGKVAKYLRTEGFKLDSADRVDLKIYNLDACIDACTNNIVRSFQFLISIHKNKDSFNLTRS